MHIRLLNIDEIDHIAPLWGELRDHHQSLTIDYHQHYIDTSFAIRKKALLGRDKLACYLANTDDQDVGFCVVSVEGDIGFIESLYVQPKTRGSGAGKALTLRGIEWLQKQAVKDIRLSVGQGNDAVMDFYKKLGFRQRAVIMQLF